MIIYKEVLEKLKEAGFSTTRLRNEKIRPEGTIQNIRQGKMINLKTVNTICNLLKCQPNDILEHIPDESDILE